MRGNPENLRQAAASKSAAARTRAEQGLQEMLRQGHPITFRGLAKTGGISLDFLYSTTDIRRRIEQLRTQQQTTTPAATGRGDSDEPSGVVRTLTAQLAEVKQTPPPRRGAPTAGSLGGRARGEPTTAAPSRPHCRPRGMRDRGRRT